MAAAAKTFTSVESGMLRDGCGRVHDYLRIAVTDRCNLRCLYCMPSGVRCAAPTETLLTDDEIVRVSRLFARLGVVKIRLTGGEPLLRPGISGLAARLAAVSGIHTVAVTTNGLRLAEKVRALRDAGVRGINVSLDSLRPERFRRIAGHDGLARVLDGITAALDCGIQPLKINMVVMGGLNDDELLDFVELTRNSPACVRFIEFMPFPGNPWCDARVVPHAAMRNVIESRHPLEAVPGEVRGRVAKEFRVPGFSGSLGFITPMTDHFCEGCSRLRLTADGSLKTCLFHAPEFSLRDAMRGGADDGDLADMVQSALKGKPRAHAEGAALAAGGGRSMFQIGG